MTSCKSPPQAEATRGDERTEPPMAEAPPDANGAAIDPNGIGKEEEAGLEQDRARQRSEYLALPATAAPTPVGSIFRTMRCPDHYGFVEDDAGAYCGKICGTYASGLCDDETADAAAGSCCESHRCDRRMNNQVPWGRPDGPMPTVCSREAKPIRPSLPKRAKP